MLEISSSMNNSNFYDIKFVVLSLMIVSGPPKCENFLTGINFLSFDVGGVSSSHEQNLEYDRVLFSRKVSSLIVYICICLIRNILWLSKTLAHALPTTNWLPSVQCHHGSLSQFYLSSMLSMVQSSLPRGQPLTYLL